MALDRDTRFVGPRRGQVVFALAFFALSALLLSQITSQTVWVDKTKLAAQPRFWPAVGLILMTVAGGLHLIRLPWLRLTYDDAREVGRWLSVLEFAGWFMVYVLLVPILGYLPVTMVFMPLLAWRMGYRDRQMLLICVAFGVAIVVLFKSFLSVKIPGAMVYEYLPGGLRTFFILNF